MPRPLAPAVRHAAVAFASAAALTTRAQPVAAQPVAPSAPRRPAPARQTVSINLLGLPFGFVSAEWERALGTSGFAVGVGGTASFDEASTGDLFNDAYNRDSRFHSVQGKLKYYPAIRGLRGVALGLTAGVASSRTTASRYVRDTTVSTGPSVYTYPLFEPFRLTTTRPTVGTVLDYNLFLGPRQRFLVGLGIGGRRVLGGRRTVSQVTPAGYTYAYGPALDRILFDGRLQVGFGF